MVDVAMTARAAFPRPTLNGSHACTVTLPEGAGDDYLFTVHDVAAFSQDIIAVLHEVIDPLFQFWADAAAREGVSAEEIAERQMHATMPMTLVVAIARQFSWASKPLLVMTPALRACCANPVDGESGAWKITSFDSAL